MWIANPSAMLADVLLPASMPWESENLKTSFAFPKGASAEAARWAQMRKVVVPPPPREDPLDLDVDQLENELEDEDEDDDR